MHDLLGYFWRELRLGLYKSGVASRNMEAMGDDCMNVTQIYLRSAFQMRYAIHVVTSCLIVALATPNLRVSAVTLSMDTILGPDHPYTSETIVVIDGVDPPTEVEVREGALIGGLPGEPTQSIGFDVYGNSIVTMHGGRVKGSQQSVLLHDQSIFHMLNGEIETAQIELLDESRAFLNGGNWGAAFANDSSRVFIRGGDSGFAQAFDDARVVMSAGRPDDVDIYDNASFVMHDGIVNIGLTTSGHSRALLNGGSAYIVQVLDQSELRIRGGDIVDELFVEGSGVAHFYGSGLHFGIDPFTDHPAVMGTLASGESVSVNYHILNRGQIILHEVPEPASWALLGVGAAGVFVARRRYSVVG